MSSFLTALALAGAGLILGNLALGVLLAATCVALSAWAGLGARS